MSATATVRQSIRDVGMAIRRPEELAVQWRDRDREETTSPSWMVFIVLLLNALAGTVAYGMIMHMHRGASGMAEGAMLMPVTTGLAWLLAFPALYIINSMLGSRLDFTTTTLAASVTVSFGATAMLASIPITWFFSLALPFTAVHWAVNLVVFTGVAICMSDVFLRIMKALEPRRSSFYAFVWLLLLSAIGMQLFWLFGLLNF